MLIYSLRNPLGAKFIMVLCLPPPLNLLQSLSDSLAPPAVITVVVIVTIVAFVLSDTSVPPPTTIIGLKVFESQSSSLPGDTGSWTSAAPPPAIS